MPVLSEDNLKLDNIKSNQSGSPTPNALFWTIVFLTVACGLGAGAVALFTAMYGSSANMDQLFATFSHFFAGGIGVIFGSRIVVQYDFRSKSHS